MAKIMLSIYLYSAAGFFSHIHIPVLTMHTFTTLFLHDFKLPYSPKAFLFIAVGYFNKGQFITLSTLLQIAAAMVAIINVAIPLVLHTLLGYF